MSHQPESPDESATPIVLSEIISALTFALDLTEGAVPGHALRCTLIGMRIAAELDLPDSLRPSLYYALQLKDVGCSSNSARVAQMFRGSDQRAKALSKLTDWSGLFQTSPEARGLGARVAELASDLGAVPKNLRSLWHVVQPEGRLRDRVRCMVDLGKYGEQNTREVISMRCDRGASILRKLHFQEEVCEAVRQLDEHWDGSGYAEGLQGDQISLLARICFSAQNLDVFAVADGTEAAIRSVKWRSGTWFDPELVRIAASLHAAGKLWDYCRPGTAVEVTRRMVLDLSPETPQPLPSERIDGICEAFSSVIDAKSPFTYRHSLGVTRAAEAMAEELGYPEPRLRLLRRAALLHDVGKLGVSNTILDKPGALTAQERAAINEHPLMSRTILERISSFGELARIAGEHHEKLDGSGYPLGLRAEQLCQDSRLLTVADCFSALAEDRPYRRPIPLPEVLSILGKHAPRQLDGGAVELLKTIVNRRADEIATWFQPAPLTVCAWPRTLGAVETFPQSGVMTAV